MGKIVLSENVTLDGVIQDPTGEEGFGRGGWFGQRGLVDELRLKVSAGGEGRERLEAQL